MKRVNWIVWIIVGMMFTVIGCGQKSESEEEKARKVEPPKNVALTRKQAEKFSEQRRREKKERRSQTEADGKKSTETRPLTRKQLISKGEMARDFKGTNRQGKTVELKDFKGKYVLLDFWASWCAPCRKEMPYLKKLHEKYKDNDKFEIVGISLDRSKKQWIKYMDKNNMVWPNLLDNAKTGISFTYGVKSIPFTVLIDPEGKVIATRLRGDTLLKEISGRLKS